MTRLKTLATGSTVPLWDVIVALLPIKSQHVTFITRVLDQTSHGEHIHGVLGTVTCGEHEFPCFIDAELDSHAAHRAARNTADPGSCQPAVAAEMAHVFSQFCTPKPRPYGRNASFQDPPEYNPDHESIQSSETQGGSGNRREAIEAPRAWRVVPDRSDAVLISRLDANHPIDLIVGAAANQRAKMLQGPQTVALDPRRAMLASLPYVSLAT